MGDFTVHDMIFDLVDPYRLKGASANMQRNVCKLNALRFQGRKHDIIKM